MDPQAEMEKAGLGGLHPFQVFPEEVWPFIAYKLEDSADILRLIQAIPEITEVLEIRKRRWLFDQIIPHISRWLGWEDVLTCRRVCKNWAHGVDNFLENHPGNRAYDPGHQVTGQVWTYKGEQTRYFPNGDRLIGIHDFPINTNGGNWPATVTFANAQGITSFLRDIETHPRSRNPIVGRSVRFNFLEDLQVLPRISEVTSRIGNHIWFISFNGDWTEGSLNLCTRLKEWMGHLPNLKAIDLSIWLFLEMAEEAEPHDGNEDAVADNGNEGGDPVGDAAALESDLEPILGTLPALPHLESLKLSSGLPPALTKAVVASYSHQIRRLLLEYVTWRSEYSTIFPNLTELQVYYMYKQDMTGLLLSIEAPLLYALDIDLDDIGQPGVVTETDVLPVLKRFPVLEHLTLQCYNSPTRGSTLLSPERDSIPSLKNLAIPKCYLHTNTDFLLCFPNLEYLSIFDDDDLLLIDSEAPRLEPTLRIWESIENGRMYESNVWELLPKLKKLNLPVLWNEDPVIERPFHRETWEHRRRNGAAGAGVEPEAQEAN